MMQSKKENFWRKIIYRKKLTISILDLQWSEGGPDQYSWAPLACIDQSKANYYILQTVRKFKNMHTQ